MEEHSTSSVEELPPQQPDTAAFYLRGPGDGLLDTPKIAISCEVYWDYEARCWRAVDEFGNEEWDDDKPVAAMRLLAQRLRPEADMEPAAFTRGQIAALALAGAIVFTVLVLGILLVCEVFAQWLTP